MAAPLGEGGLHAYAEGSVHPPVDRAAARKSHLGGNCNKQTKPHLVEYFTKQYALYNSGEFHRRGRNFSLACLKIIFTSI